MITAVVALLAATWAFVSLGQWQLRRADEHRQLRLNFSRSADLPALKALPSAQDAAHLRYRRVRLDGSYVSGVDVLLDNMTHGEQVGYQVLTPFRPDDASTWLMVNRGWVPADPDRRVLPRIRLGGTPPRAVTGRVAPFPAPAIRLGSSAPQEVRPGLLLASYPTSAGLGKVLGRSVYPYELLLDPQEPEGFTRDWRPHVMSPQRNLAYAAQWFAFALFAFVAAGVIVFKRRPATAGGNADAR